MIHSARRWIVGGLLLVIFSITINNLPIFPDFVGYFCMAVGFGKLANIEWRFSWAKWCAILLAIIDIIQFSNVFEIPRLYVADNDPIWRFSILVRLAISSIDLLMLWFAVQGVLQIKQQRDSALYDASRLLWVIYAIFGLIQIFTTGLDQSLMVFGSGIIYLVVNILVWLGFFSYLRTIPEPSVIEAYIPPVATIKQRVLILGSLFGLILLMVLGFYGFQPPSAKQIRTIPHLSDGLAHSVAWNPRGDAFVVASNNAPTLMYDLNSAKPSAEVASQGSVVLWNEQGILVLGQSGNLYNQQGQMLRCILSCNDQQFFISASAQWHEPSHTLVIVDDYVVVYDTQNITRTNDFPLSLKPHKSIKASMSPDGNWLAFGDERDFIRVIDRQGEQVKFFFMHFNESHYSRVNSIRDLALSPDGTWLAVASTHNIVDLWNVESETLERSFVITTWFQKQLQRTHDHVQDWATTLEWNPTGTLLAVGSSDASAGIWDPHTGQQVLRLNGHSNDVLDIKWSPDGQRVATASSDDSVIIWDVAAAYR